MTNRFNLKFLIISLAALLVAVFIGYSVRGSSISKSDNIKSASVVTTNVNGAQSSSTNSTNSTASPLKSQCTNALKDYGTSVRTKAETMANNIRTQVKNAGNNANISAYQPQIDQLLAYIKTMQTNMSTLQACITKSDQNHTFSATELADINAAIAASKS